MPAQPQHAWTARDQTEPDLSTPCAPPPRIQSQCHHETQNPGYALLQAARLRAGRAAALEEAEAAKGQLATAQLQLRKAGLDAAAAAQNLQRAEQDLAVRD